MPYHFRTLHPLKAVTGTQQMDILFGNDISGMQRLIRCNGTLQFHLCRGNGRVDIQFFFSQPTFGNTDITYHAVHTVGAKRALLIGSLHAAVDGNMLLYDFRTHTHGNDRSGNTDGMVGEADAILPVVLFQIGDSLQIQIIRLGRILGYTMQDRYVVMITGNHLQSIIQFFSACHAGRQNNGYLGFSHHFQQRQVGKIAACHFQTVGREEFQQREAAFGAKCFHEIKP